MNNIHKKMYTRHDVEKLVEKFFRSGKASTTSEEDIESDYIVRSFLKDVRTRQKTNEPEFTEAEFNSWMTDFLSKRWTKVNQETIDAMIGFVEHNHVSSHQAAAINKAIANGEIETVKWGKIYRGISVYKSDFQDTFDFLDPEEFQELIDYGELDTGGLGLDFVPTRSRAREGISSWTTNFKVAKNFADSHSKIGVVFEAIMEENDDKFNFIDVKGFFDKISHDASRNREDLFKSSSMNAIEESEILCIAKSGNPAIDISAIFITQGSK